MAIFGFDNFIGLLGLLALIPFLILYFIRPKPKEVAIPSLMFLGKNQESKSKGGFFRKIVNDKLLLLQIIILGLVSLFFAAPYLMVSDVGGGNVVFVLDTSASMDDEKFETLKETAMSNIGDKNTIILVGSKPSLILESGDSSSAKKEIEKLERFDTRTAISESLILAKNVVEDISGEKAVVIVSDFLETENGNVENSLESLKELEIPLKIVSLETKNRENIGFVSLILREGESQAVVKNFCCNTKDITLNYGGKETEIKLGNGESYTYNFKLKNGLSELSIKSGDMIEGDNVLYLNNQKDRDAEVVLVTRDDEKYLEAALSAASNIDLDVKTPESVRGNYDLYVLSEIGNVPESLSALMDEELNKGKGVIIVAEESLSGDYGFLDFDILEGTIGGMAKNLVDIRFLENVNFGKQESVKAIDCGKCDGVYVAIDEDPVVMIKSQGKGLVGYYGVLDNTGGFENKPDFPIFWTRFAQHLSGMRSLNGMNLKTGSSVAFGDDVKYETPSGEKGKGEIITFNEAGFYKVNGLDYSANLLSEKESSLTILDKVNSQSDDSEVFGESETVKRSIWKDLLLLALFLFFIEWFILSRKIRRRKYNV